MPKDTFLNLPAEKRQYIEKAAIEEFATWGFDNASINRIVSATRIAKGSFYQYFEDKKDLFKHIVARIGEEKLNYMSPVLANPEAHDFFTLVSELYRSGLAFAKENPTAAMVGNLVFQSKEHSVYKEVFSDGKDTGKAFFKNLIENGISDGVIRPDLNQEFIAHILLSMSISIFDYYFEVVKGDNFDVREIDDDIMETVTMTLDFIKNGITPQKELAL